MGELLIEASQVVARRRCLAASVVREDDVGDKVTSGAFAADATGTAGRRAAHVLGDDISVRHYNIMSCLITDYDVPVSLHQPLIISRADTDPWIILQEAVDLLAKAKL